MRICNSVSREHTAFNSQTHTYDSAYGYLQTHRNVATMKKAQ